MSRLVASVFLVVLAGCGSASAPGVRAGSSVLTAPLTSIDVPTVGDDLGATIQTCEVGRWRGTPTSAGACLSWGGGTPVNVVVVFRAPQHVTRLAPSWAPLWKPAHGQWLVARGNVLSECATGSPTTSLQIEQRLSAISRHHVKFVEVACTDGTTMVAFGSAHTDRYDMRACGGDYAVNLDAARDAFVRSVERLGARVQVTYSAVHAPGQFYDGGCGQTLRSDGRVAYIVVAGS